MAAAPLPRPETRGSILFQQDDDDEEVSPNPETQTTARLIQEPESEEDLESLEEDIAAGLKELGMTVDEEIVRTPRDKSGAKEKGLANGNGVTGRRPSTEVSAGQNGQVLPVRRPSGTISEELPPAINTKHSSTGSRSALSAFLGHPKHRRRPSSSGSITSLFVQQRDRASSIRSIDSESGRDPSEDTSISPSDTASINAGNHRRVSSRSVDTNDSGSPATPMNGHSGYGSGEESEFLMARLEEQKRSQTPVPEGAAAGKDKKAAAGYWPSTYLQTSFQAVKESLTGGEGKPTVEEEQIDWDFWGKVMNDYETTVRRHPRTFTRKLQQGLPDAIRGMVWQLMCKGKSPDLEAQYATLLTRTSIHEKIIQRDLARTFPKHDRFAEQGGPGQESLFNIIKAYSLFDPEIGYCQGIAFIVGALLLNMPDEEAFCVLVRLMKEYNLRELYTPQMVGLQLRLYQFDKLLEEQFPHVFLHLEEQEVKSTMYASQWFMTMFAYRFPLPIVFRLMDIIFAEGIDSMLRFALALIKRNVDTIVTLEFEPLLEFLKNGLFDVYGGSVTTLIVDASSIRLTKGRLDRLNVDFTDMMRKTSPEAREVKRLEFDNRRLLETIRRMEHEFEQLNREHIELANSYLSTRVLADSRLATVEILTAQIDGLEKERDEARKVAEEQVKEEMERLAVKNLELTTRNMEVGEEVTELGEVLEMERKKYEECEKERGELVRKWNGLKKALG